MSVGSMGEAEQITQSPPSWLNKDFIEKALRSGEQDSTIVVTSFQVLMANAAGDGYGSDMYRIIAKILNSHERRAIVKCLPQKSPMAEAVRTMGLFETEISMLSEILPEMQKLLDKAATGKFQPFAAKYLYHGSCPVDFLVLEDLRHSGFTLAKRQQGLDLAHCILAMKTIGRYHATSVTLLDHHPELIIRHDKPLYRKEVRSLMEPMIKNGIQCLAKEVMKWPEYEKYGTKLNRMLDSIFDRLEKIYRRKDNEFNTLSHGDSWSANMMFKYTNDVPQDMRLVDFQMSYFCSPALDLNYFLNSCPNINVRLNQLDNLLREYHRSFAETLDILGCSKHFIPFDQVLKTFKDYSFYGFVTAAAVLPIALAGPEITFDVEDALKSGDDTNNRNSKLYANDVYVQAMKKLLPLFDEEGLLD